MWKNHTIIYLEKIRSHPTLQKNKYLLKKIIGYRFYYLFRNNYILILSLIQKKRQQPVYNSNRKSTIYGVNIAGHVTAESGVGEAVRSLINCVSDAKIPFCVNNFELNIYRKQNKSDYLFFNHNPFKINLVQINPDQVDGFYTYMTKNYFLNKYTIGFWLWEQSTFPKEWNNRFSYFSEIWTASSFSLEALKKVSPIPVIKVPLSIENNKNRELSQFNRDYFSLPSNTYIFLFIFDFSSVSERKNPQAIAHTFLNTFSDKDNVLLLFKTVNAKYDPHTFTILKSYSDQNTSIKVIDGYMSKKEVNGLLSICDCYVSLHRAEGFGYTMFEAMSYGKPVIATAYSGNMDYMNNKNSFLVKYKLIKLEKDFGPYKKGTLWADPDIQHASTLMKKVYQKRNYAQKIGEKAADDIKLYLSNKVIGNIIKNRLKEIRKSF